MKALIKLKSFLASYRKESVIALILLTSVVFMDLAIPRLIQRIIDQGIALSNPTIILQTTLIMLGITVLSAVFAIGNNLYSVRVGEGVGRDLRAALFLKIQSFSFGNLDHMQTGQLMVRLTSDIAMLQRIVRVAIRIGTRAPLLMVGSILLMVATSRQLALAILPLLVVMGVIIIWFISHTQPLFLSVQRRLDTLNTVLQENIAGVRVVKAFNQGEYEIERFSAANLGYAEGSIRVMQFMAFLMPSLTFLINLGIVIVIWAGGMQSIHGDLTNGEIVAFTNYLLTTMTPLVIMANLAQVLAAANVSAERINQVLETAVDVQDQPDAVSLPANMAGKVAFEHVFFSYSQDGSEPVLEDISLAANPGETIAILGATGSGKTTLVNLIPRFYEVTSGSISIDGIDVRSLQQQSLLAHIGVVPQETVLFAGTVAENIRFGRPQASDAEVITAARAAQAHDFILELPEGYETHVEQRGVNFSGGQKQRIAIARALLMQPKILILDDSTSSVDVETETKIQAALETLLHGRTSFVVAQRISTVLNADRILVLDHGRVAASGSHTELMQTSTIYQEIFDSQLGGGMSLQLLDEVSGHD
jgi:ATP-binding cassette subfamily B multidrug efflux pump